MLSSDKKDKKRYRGSDDYHMNCNCLRFKVINIFPIFREQRQNEKVMQADFVVRGNFRGEKKSLLRSKDNIHISISHENAFSSINKIDHMHFLAS